jgi:hypothetical protein
VARERSGEPGEHKQGKGGRGAGAAGGGGAKGGWTLSDPEKELKATITHSSTARPARNPPDKPSRNSLKFAKARPQL